jgi:V/A-type H+-transporting ATPase subunit C
MTEVAEQPIIDFYTYPPVGTDDWRYLWQTAQVRMLETHMMSKATFLDMVNAETFEQAADFLSASEYALPPSKDRFAEAESILLHRRIVLRELFGELMIDKQIEKLFRTRDDFANLRLAIRRMLTKKPPGTDYSSDGNVTPQQLKEAFEQENYGVLPDYMQQAAEQAVLAYYQTKDIRQIDSAIDSFQAEFNLRMARKLKNIFLLGLFRIQVDLTNIRTMLRLKFNQAQPEFSLDKIFLKGGYIAIERLEHGIAVGYESLGPLFFVTPYCRVVEVGANYLSSNKSFLKVEQQCDEHLTEFLKSTIQIVTGPQPIIAYFLMKENEIRTVRLVLTAKRNHLDTKLILDRIS